MSWRRVSLAQCSILPFDVIGLILDSNGLSQLRILRIVRLLRLMKLVRIFKATRCVA